VWEGLNDLFDRISGQKILESVTKNGEIIIDACYFRFWADIVRLILTLGCKSNGRMDF
jgi:hypothetical protein